MVLKISKEPPRVSKALFRLYTDYQLFMQKCFRKDRENFRKMRSRPHRQNKAAQPRCFLFWRCLGTRIYGGTAPGPLGLRGRYANRKVGFFACGKRRRTSDLVPAGDSRRRRQGVEVDRVRPRYAGSSLVRTAFPAPKVPPLGLRGRNANALLFILAFLFAIFGV